MLAPNRIALKVAPEASDLDYSNAIALNGVQIPSITTRRADTTVELGDGESFVIGGLVSSNVVSNVGKIRCWATCRSSARSSATSTTSARTRSW